MQWNSLLTDILFRNWQTKVACLLFACLFFLFYNVSILSSRTFTVPLVYKTIPYLTLANDFDTSTSLTVRGRESDLEQLKASDFSAIIDAGNLTEEGVYTLPILVTMTNQGLVCEIQYRPRTPALTISLERRATTLVTVIPQFPEPLGQEYQLSHISVMPASVPISGPATVINNIKQVFTKPISLTNQQESFSQVVDLILPATLSAVETPSVLVRAVIESRRETISASNIPIHLLNQSPNVQVVGIIPTGWVTITLNKGEAIGETIEDPFDSIALSVDLLDIEEAGTYNLPVQLLTSSQNMTFLFGPLSIMVNLRRH